MSTIPFANTKLKDTDDFDTGFPEWIKIETVTNGYILTYFVDEDGEQQEVYTDSGQLLDRVKKLL